MKWLTTAFLLQSTIAWGAETTLVTPESVTHYLSGRITFDEHPFKRLRGKPTGKIVIAKGAKFAEGFAGQYFRFEKLSDVTGTTTFAPLKLNPDMTVQSFDGNRASSKDYNITPIIVNNNPAISGYYYRNYTVKNVTYSGLQKDTKPVISTSKVTEKMFGTGAVSILFDVDQRMFSINLMRLSQPLPKLHGIDPTDKNDAIFIKIFRRDGTFIDEQRLINWPSGPIAIQRCYKLRDIAGIQITSDVQLGIAIDNLLFDLEKPKNQDDDGYQSKPCPGRNS